MATSRADQMLPFITTSTPCPAAAGLAATPTAWYRLAGPSAEIAVPGRMAPVKTTGLPLLSSRCSRYADSSMVSVPWVTTRPSTSSCASSSAARRASCSMRASVMFLESMANSCSGRTSAAAASSGTAASSAPALTTPAW